MWRDVYKRQQWHCSAHVCCKLWLLCILSKTITVKFILIFWNVIGFDPPVLVCSSPSLQFFICKQLLEDGHISHNCNTWVSCFFLWFEKVLWCYRLRKLFSLNHISFSLIMCHWNLLTAVWWNRLSYTAYMTLTWQLWKGVNKSIWVILMSCLS